MKSIWFTWLDAPEGYGIGVDSMIEAKAYIAELGITRDYLLSILMEMDPDLARRLTKSSTRFVRKQKEAFDRFAAGEIDAEEFGRGLSEGGVA